MKMLSRDFTKREKILILVLAVILLALAYFRFVDQPVRESVAKARAEQASLMVELDGVNSRVARLNEMQQEIDGFAAGQHMGIMGSYNNEKAELEVLNGILGEAETYSVVFSGITRERDLIRRDFTLEFTAGSMDKVSDILTRLADSPYRCLIGDLSVRQNEKDKVVTGYVVQAEATFYETMEGGVADAGLPPDLAAEAEAASAAESSG